MPLSLRQLIDASEDRILTIRVDGTIEVCNAAVEQAYGAPLVGRNALELGDPAFLEERKSAVDLVVKRRASVRITQTVGEREADVVLSPIFGEGGDVECVLVVSRDVTAQRRMAAELLARKEALQVREERHRAFFEQAAVGIVLVDLTGRIVEVNQWILDTFGYTAAEIIALGVEGISHPDDMEADMRLFSEMAAGARDSYSLEKRYLTKDGDMLWCTVSVSWRYAEGKRVGLMGLLTDITERKKAEQALRESEERLRLIGETMPFPVALSRADDGTMVWGNRALEDFLGVPRGELIGRKTPEFYTDPEQRARLLATLVRDGQVDAMEITMRRGDGTLVRGLASVRPMTIGGVPMLVGASVDITELKRAQDELRQRDEVQETLVREINHRVRNNLASIIGLLRLQRSNTTSDPERAIAALVDVEHRVNAIAIVHELLSSRMWSPVPLAELCNSIVTKTVDAVCQHVGTNEIDIRAPALSIDSHAAHQLAWVLGELSTNACKYGHSPDGPLRLAVSASHSGDTLALRFADRGPGFSDDILRSGEREGHIGLRLVANIVRNSLNGAVRLHNDGGAAVTIEIPHDS